MENVEGMEAQVLKYQKIEEVLADKDCEFFDTILSVSSVDLLKNKLKVLKDQGIDVHGVFLSHFHFFTTEKTLNFPESTCAPAINHIPTG